MNIEDGNYAAAIDKLTARTTSQADPSSTAAATTAAQVDVDPAEYGLGPLHRLASRQHPPVEQTMRVMAKVKRSRWLRTLAALGVFLLGQVLSLIYVGVANTGQPNKVFFAISVLTWAGPVVAWFALRHRKLGYRQIQGYPRLTLAEMSAGMHKPWIEVCIPEESAMVYDYETNPDNPNQPSRVFELQADEDVIVSFDLMHVRAKTQPPTPASAAEVFSPAQKAMECLTRAIAAELPRPPDQVFEMSPMLLEDDEREIDDGGESLDPPQFLIKGGQKMNTDALCEGLIRAVNVLRNQYDLTLND